MARDTVLFDINETVLDLASLKPRFEAAFGDAGVTATWFAMLLHSSTVCTLTGVKTGFADLAAAMLDTLAARRSTSLTRRVRGEILACFAALPPHADVPPALERLKAAGYRTVAFSNSSQQLVTSQIANAGLIDHFDEVVSVEETGSFKPDPKVYAFVASHLCRKPSDLRLVATHDWDTHGALSAGMLAAYIDRTGAPYHPLYLRPDILAKTMDEIACAIIAKDAGAM